MVELHRSNYLKKNLLPVLKTVDQWVCWAYHRNKHRSDKIPLNTNNYLQSRKEFKASPYHDKNIWLSYEEARDICNRYTSVDGIGFVIENKNLCYVDIDNCVRPRSLTTSDKVWEIIHDVESYTEFSSSGTGINMICSGSLDTYGWTPAENPIEISVFDRMWVAVTEDHIAGTPKIVQRCSRDLGNLCEEYNFDTHGGWQSTY